MRKSICAAAALACAAGGAAHAGTAVFEFNRGEARGDSAQFGINDNGGEVASVMSSFNPANNRFTFSVRFADQVTRGLTLAVNGGPNPKGIANELALLYVDASDLGDLEMAAYSYNGRNSSNSWQDGDANQSGQQAGDLIKGVNDTDYILDLRVVDDAEGRTFVIDIDASDIIDHSPLYGPSSDWTGIGFGDAFGIWMHPFRSFDADYDADGRIVAFDGGGEGWFDGRGFATRIIPLPGASAMAGLGLAGLAVRRRR